MTASPNHVCSLVDRMFSWRSTLARCAACPILVSTLVTLGGVQTVAASSLDKMLNATPLVLKDGRIAEVSVHTIPFPGDAAAPASKTKSRLDAFTQSIATDCFLTAQVIGHVDKSEINGRETADIHRLARARADTIQASLVQNGLPASSIASVWDWRFMVQEPRVTLWVFRLTTGDDCEDNPIGIQTADQIAEAPTVAETPAVEAPPSLKPTETASTIEKRIVPAARPKSADANAPVSGTRSSPIASSMASANPAESLQTAALSPIRAVSDRDGPITLGKGNAIAIVFDTNSSFFPAGAGDQLRTFLKTLDKSKSYVLRIQTSVDGDASVTGASSTDEAQRYNTWLAERRSKRVEAWLETNGGDFNFTLEPSLIENDGSRRVLIDPQPMG
jgi:outer membrane protein OmpA-like peptidoglycan-associated protein